MEGTLKEKSAAVGRRRDGALFPGCKYVVKIWHLMMAYSAEKCDGRVFTL